MTVNIHQPADALAIGHHVEMAEIEDGKSLADPVFQRRYKTDAPDFPLHVFARCRGGARAGAVLCYIHFTAQGDLLLGGGACVDDRELRLLSPEARTALRAVGGLYRHSLAWAVDHFRDRYKAVFGYCGDPLAERIDLAVGFRKTQHKHLLVRYTQPLAEIEQARLVAQAHAIGPF